MRISDWSSDVCSSDLPNPGTPGVFCICGPLLSGRVRLNPGNRGGNLDGNGATAPTVTAKGGAVALTDTAIRRAKRSEERRVGKSVSVRVDLGGRSIIKKKKNQQYT